MTYGTIIDNQLHPAPRAVRIGGVVVCNPTDAQYEQAGYKRVVDTPPQTDAAHYAVPTGWAEAGGEIVRQYDVREYPPPPPRRWSRLAIKTALAQAGMLTLALDYLAIVEIAPGYFAADALTDIPGNRDMTISTTSSMLMNRFFIIAPPNNYPLG